MDKFSTIEEAIEDIKQGKMIIIVTMRIGKMKEIFLWQPKSNP